MLCRMYAVYTHSLLYMLSHSAKLSLLLTYYTLIILNQTVEVTQDCGIFI